MSQNYWRSGAEVAAGHNLQSKIGRVINIKDDKDVDGKPRFRVQVRTYEQNDIMAWPDDKLPWYRIKVPTTSQGATPYIKPGMWVQIMQTGGTPGDNFAGYVDGIVSYDTEHGLSDEELKTFSTTERPRIESDKYPVGDYNNKDLNLNEITMEVEFLSSGLMATKDAWKKTPADEDLKKHTKSRENRHNRTDGGKYADEKDVGKSPPEVNLQSMIKRVDSFIQRDGEWAKNAISSLEQLQQVKGNMNPTATASIGAGNMLSVISQLQSLFKLINSQSKKSSKKKKEEDQTNSIKTETDCSLSDDQLTDAEKEWCDQQRILQQEADSEGSTS